MTAQLLMTCGLTDKRLPEHVLIRESNNSDASFFVSSILGQQLKAASKIVLVCVHHSFSHYQSVGMRIGYNLEQVCERGRLKVVDLLKLVREDFLQLDEGDRLVAETYRLIAQQITVIPEAEDCCVIIDDISVLRMLCESDDLVIRFVEKLKSLSAGRSGHTSFIVKLNTYDLFPVLANNLANRATLTINVDSLKSGRFKEVDGRITICKPNEEKSLLYKVNDRNIKTFAKGFNK